MEPVLDKEKQSQKEQLQEPKKFHAVILNDDFSTWELVVEVATTFFSNTEDQANRIASDVHKKGKGVCGIYSKDIAETKVALANEFCKLSGMPLLLQIQEE